VGFGIARMFQAMVEADTLEWGVFRELAEAAAWLGIPVEILGEEAGA
jgi:hypothetical protein